MTKPSKQRRMAKRKIEVLESYLQGDKTVTPLLANMGLREVNEQIARIKLAQLGRRMNP